MPAVRVNRHPESENQSKAHPRSSKCPSRCHAISYIAMRVDAPSRSISTGDKKRKLSFSGPVADGPGSGVTITSSGSLERVEGSGPFTATCTAVCNPSCTITWRKDNSDLTSGQISLSNVSRTDQGDYTCQAQNSIGGPQQTSITLVVYYLVSPHLTFNKMEVMENATVTVDCDVDSNPTVEMTVRNVDNNTVLVQRNTNTLSHTIQRAQCLHNGSYVCSADNRETGTVHHSTMPLNVLCSPRHDFRKQLNGVVAQNKNTTAFLTADIIANPLPNFTWYRYGGGFVSPIRNTTGITVTSTALQSVLQIYITSDANYGDYAVSVQNSVGQTMMVFTLTSKRNAEQER
ncbi:neural cell adhesion molecule 1-like [Haliotis cracherodii]|uniref:neural cell adhesion molecule 1-like n=1 Tax=Haliotis cracherodii TaxID=6455 RepID=UPI0039E90C8F